MPSEICIMEMINLGYVRGVYDFLYRKTDEELECFDINSCENRDVLFEEMARTFAAFGPIAKKNIVNGLNFIWNDCAVEKFWRHALPHDLPLNRVFNRKEFIEGIVFALTNGAPSLLNGYEFTVVDEIGPHGLDFSI